MSKLAFVLLAMFIVPAVAQTQTEVGRWTTGVTPNKTGVYAATMNDSGAILGEYCFFASKSCSWVIDIDSACEKDHVYPVLGNTDKGAAHFELVCKGQLASGLYGYVFKNWQDLERLIKAGARVGIATPSQADQFKVSRFMLDGLAQSTKSIEAPFFAAVAGANGQAAKVANSRGTESL